ncbi:phospho-N-acetylmuramoyl-pentapeptide-transferase [Cerasicoccus maritimus]|uniref:phospho-N-acetylmuramoyl-pentapeptide- transferase n=1 Tax=Cerasicoccus maritimus TaxID=490089 RepID=UPI002852C4DF|nr:phospho-N-acetylmuramoyl-pentapeptide-transferase [Cerasicoccus maritimus]
MLTYLAGLEDIWGPFRLFGSITFRMMMAAATALCVGFIIAPPIFDRLRRLKAEQIFRNSSEVGKLADLHASKKSTPTMGGLMIFAAVTGSSILWAKPNVYVITALVVYAGLTAIGFFDDYLKVTKKSSAGLSSRWKLAGQALLTFLALGLLLGNSETRDAMRELWLPFVKFAVLDPMPLWFAFIFFFFVLAGSSNAINLTDGIDGLAIGCTVTVAIVYAVMAYAAGNSIIADYFLLSYIPGTGELAVVCTALIGGSLAFLWHNSHPATVFMGDTGSLALGGLIGSIAFMVHQPVTLVIVGGIFVMEAVSVILQVGSFKLTGKRIFRMAPIHHHFELAGWHESKVVIRFWILSLIFAFIGLASLKLR